MSYEVGNAAILYCSFLTLSNQEPTTIVDPKITIRHIDNSNILITDVNEAAMILADENNYYYRWVIPTTAFIGNYNVECEAIVDGDYTESNFRIQVT